MYSTFRIALVTCLLVWPTVRGLPQDLERQLLSESPRELVAVAREAGDARRGAIVFFQHGLACARCHANDDPAWNLGPDLAHWEKPVSDEYLVEAVLRPSKEIRRGYETVSLTLVDGRRLTGLVADEGKDVLALLDPSRPGQRWTIPQREIEERSTAAASLMPTGQVNQLASRQQFLDLLRYLFEIRDGGPARARDLRPDASLLVAAPLPEYEQRLDHARLIRGWNAASLKRGEAIYERVCANCHGTHDRPGSLPTSLRFAEGRFKNGSDPFAMYQTLTRGFGFMVPQAWMVPRQKYDVIHYIREAYLKPRNPSQYVAIDLSYLDRLPKGDTFGPEPSQIEPWVAMDYGPSLHNTYEIPSGEGKPNFAYKGIAMRLDAGPGGVSRGGHWMLWDHDTFRLAAAWSGTGFIDWNGIHFNGRHQVHPQLVGELLIANPARPGWANPETGAFDDPRLRGRDGRHYGPLPRSWARFLGTYHFGQRTVVSYTIGGTPVLETPDWVTATSPLITPDSNQPASPVPVERPPSSRAPPPMPQLFVRSFSIGALPRPLTLLVATLPGGTLAPRPDPEIATDIPPDVEFGTIAAEPELRGQAGPRLVAGLRPRPTGVRWRRDGTGALLLDLPAGDAPLSFSLWLARSDSESARGAAVKLADASLRPVDWKQVTSGGPARWSQVVTTEIIQAATDGPFAIDVLTPPTNNPWLAQTRLTGLDFFDDGDTAAVCTWDGDVWRVSGLLGQQSAPREGTAAASPRQLHWRRIASGLFQPLGIKVQGGLIHVTCRDQLVILRDLNGDGETDFYECFNHDHQVTEHFHEFAMGLQVDAKGNWYYAKSARHALPAVVPHHGTLLRVSPDGSQTEILARGFRAANGVCLNPDGSFIVTDQEGHWNPKNRINWVTVDPSGPPRFYGNMFGYHDVTDSADEAMEPPLCWITNAFDRSPAELLWIPPDRWGPLAGSLLNFSYGYGKIYIVPHERVPPQADDAPRWREARQGGLCALPIPNFPTGIMRGRFHSADGQLYVCGMFAWAGSATAPGGFYRLRYTGKPVHLPLGLQATRAGIRIMLSDEVDPDSVKPAAFAVKIWSLKRTAEYGSKHYDERSLAVRSAVLDSDQRTIVLSLPDLEPTWCMEVAIALRTADGAPLERVIHNTIHRLGE